MYEIISATRDIQIVYFNKVIMINNQLISIKNVLRAKSEILKNVSDAAEFVGPDNSKITGKQVKELLKKTPDEISKLNKSEKLLYAYAASISGLLASGVITVEELSNYDPIKDYNKVWIDKDPNGSGKYKIPKKGSQPVAMADIIARNPGLIADLEAAKIELDAIIDQTSNVNVDRIGPMKVVMSPRLEKIMNETLSAEDKKLVAEHISLIKAGDVSKIEKINRVLAKAQLKLKLTDTGDVKLTTKASLMIMMGPAGVGKGVIQSKFVDQNGVVKWLINNTRNERVSDGEQYGVTYHFERSDAEKSINEKYDAIKKGDAQAFVESSIGSFTSVLNFADELIDKYGITDMINSKSLSEEAKTFATDQLDFIREAVDKVRTDEGISKMSPEEKVDKIRAVEITAARMEVLSKKFDSFIAHKFVNGIDLQGVRGEFVNRILNGESIFLECDHGLARQIKENPELADIDMNILFLMPPTMTELVSRLGTRGTDPIEKVDRRLVEAAKAMKNSQGVANLYMESNTKTAERLLKETGIEVKVPITEDTFESDVINNPQRYDGRLTVEHFTNSLAQKVSPYSKANINVEIDKNDEAKSLAAIKEWIAAEFNLESGKISGDEFISKAKESFAYLSRIKKEGYMLIMNGTFAPITMGHQAMGLESLAQHVSLLNGDEGKSAGIVVIQGGDTPHKPFALAEKHRVAMTEKAAANNDFLTASRIRGLMVKAFKEMGVEVEFGGKDKTAPYSDMAAFLFLAANNPTKEIVWASGADKVNGYYNEKHLISDVLKDIIGVKSFYYAERVDEKLTVFNADAKVPADAWLHAMKDNGMFVKLNTPTPQVSSTIVRKGVLEDDVINGIVDNDVIDYMKRNVLESAFELSAVEKTLKKSMKQLGMSYWFNNSKGAENGFNSLRQDVQRSMNNVENGMFKIYKIKAKSMTPMNLNNIKGLMHKMSSMLANDEDVTSIRSAIVSRLEFLTGEKMSSTKLSDIKDTIKSIEADKDVVINRMKAKYAQILKIIDKMEQLYAESQERGLL